MVNPLIPLGVGVEFSVLAMELALFVFEGEDIKKFVEPPHEPLKIPWLIDCYRGLHYLVYWGL